MFWRNKKLSLVMFTFTLLEQLCSPVHHSVIPSQARWCEYTHLCVTCVSLLLLVHQGYVQGISLPHRPHKYACKFWTNNASRLLGTESHNSQNSKNVRGVIVALKVQNLLGLLDIWFQKLCRIWLLKQLRKIPIVWKTGSMVAPRSPFKIWVPLLLLLAESF